MPYIVKKLIYGKTYAYQYTSTWDKINKKYKKKSKYLGKVDENTGEIIKSKKIRKNKDICQIVDYGDSFAINTIFSQYKFIDLIKNVFSKYHNNILSLIVFQILEGSAMKNVESWLEGNYAKKLYKSPDLSSQKISKILSYIGSEGVKERFLLEYSSMFLNSKSGVLIDTTSLNSSIENDKNNWGYTSEGIKKTFKYLMLVDKNTKLPMYYRLIPGNIPDVSILKISLKDIKNLNLSIKEAIFDAGFHSEENINYLIKEKINFIIRLPKGRKLFKELLATTENIANIKNGVIYGKRGLFITEKMILIGKKRVYAYIIQDPKKRGSEISKNTLKDLEEKDLNKSENNNTAGHFVLLSTLRLNKEEVLPYYYSRQEIEQTFGYSKNNNNLLPLRVHGDKQLQGYLLLSFMSLIVYILLREKLKNIMTVEESLLILRSLKCKIYNSSKRDLILDLTKKQKIILSALKNMGGK